jgi:hypothetical protein
MSAPAGGTNFPFALFAHRSPAASRSAFARRPPVRLQALDVGRSLHVQIGEFAELCGQVVVRASISSSFTFFGITVKNQESLVHRIQQDLQGSRGCRASLDEGWKSVKPCLAEKNMDYTVMVTVRREGVQEVLADETADETGGSAEVEPEGE